MDALRIGEVARRTGLTVRTLRHYDDLGLLVPSGRSSGDYRLYSDADLRRLLAIQHLKSLGLGLGEIARALDDPGFDASDALARHVALVEERVAAERELLRRLRRLQHSADWQEVLAAIRLTELLRHPDAAVRLRAALDSPTAAPVETLVDQLVSDPSEGVREVVTWALVQHGDAATPALLARLADPDAGVRLQVAHALSKLGDPAAVPGLARLLYDHEPSVAAKAAFALGRSGGSDALEALLGVVGVTETAVRDAVSDAIARLVQEQRAQASDPRLLGSEASDPRPLRSEPSDPRLLRSERSERLEGLDPIAELLADHHASVREHAAEILGFVGDPAGATPLAGALSDPDAGVRFAALLALGRLGTDEAGHAIEGALGSLDERTRLLAERLVSDRRAGAPPAG